MDHDYMAMDVLFQGECRFWKVMQSCKLKLRFFRPGNCKVMESALGHGKSWIVMEINQMDAAFLTHCTRFGGFICIIIVTVRLGSIYYLV